MAVSQTLTLTEVAGSVSISDNTSKVRILWKSTQSGESYNDYQRTATYWVTINGGEPSILEVGYTLPKNTTVTILDKIVTVPHREDGTGKISVTAWMETGISAGTIKHSKELTLTTIPRETSLDSVSCNSSYFDGTITYRYTSKNASLYNRCYVDLIVNGNPIAIKTLDLGKVSASQKTGTLTFSANELSTIYTNMPNTRYGILRFTMRTYEDVYKTKEVGDGEYKGISLAIPSKDSTQPTVSMTLTPVTPYEKFASLYLQGRSKVRATFSGSGKYGATIASYAMQIDGKSYSSPYTSDLLSKSGYVTVRGVANDSRTIQGTTEQTINVIPYEGPYISPSEGSTKVICERCTAEGTPSDVGTYLHVKGKRNYTKINTNGIVNTCSVRCRYKPEGGDWSHDKGGGVGVLLWTDTSTDEFDVILDNIVTNTLLSYTVELNIIDDTYVPSAMVFDIPSESVDFELREGGKGAAFGKHAVTENMLECEWDAKFNKGVSIQGEAVADFVVEQGIVGNWYVRKWYSGYAECWYKRNADVNVDAQWGTALYYGTVAATYYPFTFAEVPSCQITCEYGDDNMSLFLATSGSSSTGRTPTVMLCRTDAQLVNVNIQYYAIGRWK